MLRSDLLLLHIRKEWSKGLYNYLNADSSKRREENGQKWFLINMVYSKWEKKLKLFIIFLILSIISLILFLFCEKEPIFFSNFFLELKNKFYCKLIPSDSEIEEMLSYFKVKQFLFYEDNSYFVKYSIRVSSY